MSTIRETISELTPPDELIAVLSRADLWLPFQQDLAVRRGWTPSKDSPKASGYRDDSIIICVSCPDYCGSQCSSHCPQMAETNST